MNQRSLTVLALAAAVVSLTACEASKSSNPLSPSVAGPIPGVDISAPKILEPTSGTKIAVDKQPVTLLMENASSTGVRPLTLLVEVATDAAFNNKVFSREGLTPGDGGRTSVRLPDPLASGRMYYWRARAQDGANSGPYSGAADFDVYTPIVIEAPTPTSPAANATVDGLRPKFVVTNAPHSGPVGPISYLIEVADSDAFTNKIAAWTAAEQPSQTTFELPTNLVYGKVYYWHVRAYDSTTTGPFSRNLAFATPSAPAPPPPPIPTPGPAPLPSGDQIDTKLITWVSPSADISNWPAASTITDVSINGDTVCITHTKQGLWPLVSIDENPPNIEAMIGVVAKVNGRWYGGAYDWMGQGRRCKSEPTANWGRDQIRTWPLDASWPGPRSGDEVGLYMSTPASNRIPVRSVNERTNIVLVRWP